MPNDNPSFNDWRYLTLGTMWAPPDILQELYEANESPDMARAYLGQNKLARSELSKPGRPKTVGERRGRGLSMLSAQQRIAILISRECAKMLGRRLEPDVRKYILQTKDQADIFLTGKVGAIG